MCNKTPQAELSYGDFAEGCLNSNGNSPNLQPSGFLISGTWDFTCLFSKHTTSSTFHLHIDLDLPHPSCNNLGINHCPPGSSFEGATHRSNHKVEWVCCDQASGVDLDASFAKNLSLQNQEATNI